MARKSSNDPKSNQYWGTLDDWSSDFAAAAIDRFDAFQKRLERSKRHARIQRSWRMFYARDRQGNCDTTEIGSAGRKGEVLLLLPNRFARLVRDHVTLVQQTKSNPEPMAVNSDPESQAQVDIARGVVEHYKREADLEGIKRERAFVAELCGDSYLHTPWDQDLGRERAVEDVQPEASDEESAEPADNADEESAEPKQRVVYEGDYRFEVRSPYETAYDRTSPEPKRPRWMIVKSPKNRWDLLQKVREETPDKATLDKLEHAIRNAPAWSEYIRKIDYDEDRDEYDDAIPVYYVYIDTSRAKPEGRMAIVIDRKTVLVDGPLAEPRIPVFRLSQGEVLFRNEATTSNHDGLPLSDALGAQLSTILSNNANFGLQRIISPRKANLVQSSIDTGAATIDYDHVDKAGKPIPEPRPWTGLQSPPELYQFYELLCSELDLVMAGSPVTRGDPKATQGDSGSKVAALFAAAQNIGSSFVGEVLRSDEELYTFLVASLRIHATLPRMITIVGEHNQFAAKEFLGKDLNRIVRVAVSQADAMRDTLQGRMATVELIQSQTPEQQKQTMAVLNTGRLEPIEDVTEPARLFLERENEALRNPSADPPIALAGDAHAEHWKSHDRQLFDPEVRKRPELVARIAAHKKQHEAFLTEGSPVFDAVALLMTGQNPLPPQGPQQTTPDQQAGPYAGPPNPNAPAPPQAQGGPPGMPGQPKPPRMPTNPVDGKQMNAGPMGGPPPPGAGAPGQAA